MVDSAPESIKYCSRCGAHMQTQPVGDRPRRRCIQCGFIHFTDPKVGVGILVVAEGQILLVRRTMQPEIGKWSIPAGYLDAGEEPEATAVREVWEETGLHVHIERLAGVYHNAAEQGGASIFILYQGRQTGGKLKAGDDADAAAFFSLDALPDLAFTSTRAAIKMLLSEQAAGPSG